MAGSQVILVLLDNWQQTGGVSDYLKWAEDPTLTHADFYTNPQIKQWYALPSSQPAGPSVPDT